MPPYLINIQVVTVLHPEVRKELLSFIPFLKLFCVHFCRKVTILHFFDHISPRILCYSVATFLLPQNNYHLVKQQTYGIIFSIELYSLFNNSFNLSLNS